VEELKTYNKVGKLAGTTNAILSLIERLVGYVFSIIKFIFWPVAFSWNTAMAQSTLFKKFTTFMFLLLAFQVVLLVILAILNGVVNKA